MLQKRRWMGLVAPLWGLCLQAHAAGLLEPTGVNSRTYTESYNASARMPDGTFVRASLMISNIGLHAGRGICRLQLVRNGTLQNLQKIVDVDGWHHAPASLNHPQSLQVGNCQLVAEPNALRWELSFDEVHAQLVVLQAPKTTPTPGYPVYKKDRFYTSELLVPFAPARLVFRPRGEAAQTREGFGSADHSRSTMLPGDLAYGWLRFRGGRPGCGRLLLVRYLTPAHGATPPKLAAYLWREGEAGPTRIAEPHMSLPVEAGPAAQLKASLFDGARPMFTVRGQRALLREAPFEEYGLMGKMVGAVVGRVVSETYDASLEDLSAPGDCKQVDGILEVDHLGG
jgi:hypothetical protein